MKQLFAINLQVAVFVLPHNLSLRSKSPEANRRAKTNYSYMDNIMEFAAIEEIKDGNKTRTAGYTIAWVIGVALVLLIVAAIWNRSCGNQMAKGQHDCAVQNRLGLLEGNMMSVKEVLTPLVADNNAIGRTLTGLSVGLNQYVDCTNKEFGHVWGNVRKLDNDVYIPKFDCPTTAPRGCGDGRNGRGCGCGLPEFEQRATYAQTGTPEVIVRNGCGNERNA